MWDSLVRCGTVLSGVGQFCQVWDSLVSCGTVLYVVGQSCKLWDSLVSCGTVLSGVAVSGCQGHGSSKVRAGQGGKGFHTQ